MANSLLNEYFTNLGKLLTSTAAFGGTTGESTESGKNREILVASTLKQHLPIRAQVVQGGIIIDSHNNRSHQIDVALCNSFSFLGGALDYGVIPVEAIVSAIEVKSTINTESLKKVFLQLDAIKKMKKEIAKSMYDGSKNLRYRTRRALTIGWFWQGKTRIETAHEWLCNPKNHITEADYGRNRPNAIYVHDKYLLICDPSPSRKYKKEAGQANPFLKKFRKMNGVLRKKQYFGKEGTPRDIYHFKNPDFQPIQILLMWLSHEINRYIWEIPDVAAYVSHNNQTKTA
jgi:hypothetical protein